MLCLVVCLKPPVSSGPTDGAVGWTVSAGWTAPALHPGQLRTQAQSIGVATPYGRRTPDALTEA